MIDHHQNKSEPTSETATGDWIQQIWKADRLR